MELYDEKAISAQEQARARREKKNAQSRDRASRMREVIRQIQVKPAEDRTEEEKSELEKYEQRRTRKNDRSRERAIEKKVEVSRILDKPERKRTKLEITFLEIELNARSRKNEGDRIRRKVQKLTKQGLPIPQELGIRQFHKRNKQLCADAMNDPEGLPPPMGAMGAPPPHHYPYYHHALPPYVALQGNSADAPPPPPPPLNEEYPHGSHHPVGAGTPARSPHPYYPHPPSPYHNYPPASGGGQYQYPPPPSYYYAPPPQYNGYPPYWGPAYPYGPPPPEAIYHGPSPPPGPSLPPPPTGDEMVDIKHQSEQVLGEAASRSQFEDADTAGNSGPTKDATEADEEAKEVAKIRSDEAEKEMETKTEEVEVKVEVEVEETGGEITPPPIESDRPPVGDEPTKKEDSKNVLTESESSKHEGDKRESAGDIEPVGADSKALQSPIQKVGKNGCVIAAV